MPRFKVTLHDYRVDTNVVTYHDAPSITLASRDVWSVIPKESQHHYSTSVELADSTLSMEE